MSENRIYRVFSIFCSWFPGFPPPREGKLGNRKNDTFTVGLHAQQRACSGRLRNLIDFHLGWSGKLYRIELFGPRMALQGPFCKHASTCRLVHPFSRALAIICF